MIRAARIFIVSCLLLIPGAGQTDGLCPGIFCGEGLPSAGVPGTTVKWTAEGDSITAGLGGQPAWPFTALSAMPGGKPGTPGSNTPTTGAINGAGHVTLNDIATTGISTITADTNYSTRAGASFDATFNLNILSIMLGTNTSGASDTSANQKYWFVRDYLRKAQVTGFQRLAIGSMIARDDDGGTTWTNVLVPLNALFNSYFNSDMRADVYVNFAANSAFSPAAAADNLTYYISDKLHPNVTGEALMGALAEPGMYSLLKAGSAKSQIATLFAVNSLDSGAAAAFSNSNRTLSYTGGAGANGCARGLLYASSGKIAFQVSIDAIGAGGRPAVGLVDENFPWNFGAGPNIDNSTHSIAYRSDGLIFVNAVQKQTTAVTFTTGDLVDVEADLGAKRIWLRRNRAGVVQPWNGNVAANPATGIGGIDISGFDSTPYHPAAQVFASGDQTTTNFAASQFSNFVPDTGFSAIAP